YQGIFYVVVPTRMTIVRLESGGLLIYGAIAATAECVGLIRELEAEYGSVKYLIVPTISGLEHKAYVGPFSRHFPEAQVYVAPGQWSFPVNLPLSWLGFPIKRTHILPTDTQQTPFSSEFDYAILGPLDLKLGKFGEVAFFHRRSQTLLVTDTVISIPEHPPEIVEIDAYPLLFHAKEKTGEQVIDNLENRRKGWQRICLFSLYFQAHSLQIKPLIQAWQESQRERDRGFQNFFGVFPFHWQNNWQQSFQQLRFDGRLLVAPILQQLILNRYPELTLNWVEKICQWPFTRVIPAHFEIPLSTTPEEFRQAFTFLEKQLLPDQELLVPPRSLLPVEDFGALQAIDQFLCKYKIIPPPQLEGRSQFDKLTDHNSPLQNKSINN
ncbi:MAG: DUF4336 domain-containing protein, partial [Microcystaceae cyanobacterium]